MKQKALLRTAAPAALCAGLCLTGSMLSTQAQVTQADANKVSSFVGNRAEVGVVLGATDAASSGSYTVESDKKGQEDLDYSLMKIGGGGEVGKPRPLGQGGIQWSPVLFGSLSLISGKNDITAGPLAKDKIEDSAFAGVIGGGMALHLSERWTLTPTVAGIYGHYEIDYTAHTALGKDIKKYLDDSADSLGVAPGLGIAYKIPAGKTTIELSAHYTYYATEDISDSNLDIGGSSHVFEQRFDIDIPLPYELWNCPLHTGGYLAATETAGDIKDTMESDMWGTIHGRLLLNTEGKLWKLSRAGIGASYIMADNFTGYDFGIEIGFKF
jgi:hypothetical protein